MGYTHGAREVVLTMRPGSVIRDTSVCSAHACTLLKTRFVDLVNLKCMMIETYENDVKCLVCETIDDYIKYEQHRLNVISQVRAEDVKVENKYYGNAILLNRLSTSSFTKSHYDWT
jgi:hypothetical protein